jgi:hypothetical protein
VKFAYASPRDARPWSVRTSVRFLWVFVNVYGLLWLFMVGGLWFVVVGWAINVCVRATADRPLYLDPNMTVSEEGGGRAC